MCKHSPCCERWEAPGQRVRSARGSTPRSQLGVCRGDACAGSARTEQEQGEEGDATDREALAPAPGLLIQLTGLIPEVPRRESGLSGLRQGRLPGRLGMAGNHRHHCRECSLPAACPSARHSPVSPAVL